MSDPKSSHAGFRRVLLVIATACAFVLSTAIGGLAADTPTADTAKSKPMNMDEPMAGGMKKEGMKKGDVKKAAEKKDRKMRRIIEKEQQPADTVKQ